MIIVIAPVFLVLILGSGFIYLLTYGLPWNRLSSDLVLQSNEKIEELTYRINADFSEKNNVQTTVYLRSIARNKKLSEGSTLMVNGQVIKPEYYNTGAATGYKYSAEVPRATEYTLLIKRAGEEDIKRTVTSRNFSVDFPETISKSKSFSLAYMADTVPTEAKPFVVLTSSAKEPILANDKYKFGLDIYTKIENEKIVIDQNSILAQEMQADFKNLKNGPILLYVGAIFTQPEGLFVVGKERQVEIVD